MLSKSKRIIALVLCILLALPLTACRRGGADSSAPNSAPVGDGTSIDDGVVDFDDPVTSGDQEGTPDNTVDNTVDDGGVNLSGNNSNSNSNSNNSNANTGNGSGNNSTVGTGSENSDPNPNNSQDDDNDNNSNGGGNNSTTESDGEKEESKPTTSKTTVVASNPDLDNKDNWVQNPNPR